MGILQNLGQLWDQPKLDKLAGQYYQQSQDDPSGRTGLASKARHTAASSAFSDKIARALGGDNPGKVAQFAGDVGSWIGGGLHELGTPRQLLTKDTWEDIKANTAGTFGTKFGKSAEDIYSGIYSPALSKTIDPAGRNLFTQYYEDDPYAGIRGQTAMLDPFSIYAMTKAGLGKKQIVSYLARNKAQQEMFKNIAEKKKAAEAAATKKAADAAAAKKAADAAAAKEKKLAQSKKVIYDQGSGGGGGGGTWHQQTKAKEKAGKQVAGPGFGKGAYFKDGGLINFFKNGGFLG